MWVSRRGVVKGAGAAAALAALAGCSSTVRAIARSSGPSSPSPSVDSPSRTGSAPPSSSPAAPSSARATAGYPAVAAQVSHGPRTGHRIALTFHGAGDPGIARELLAVFAEHRAKVTVLAVGTWLEAYPQLGREIARQGHELGNHTYRHLDIDSLDREAARREIVRCRDVLKATIGTGGAHFRQSQSPTATPLVRRLAAEAGYPVCLSYDVDSLDYTDPGPTVVRANVARAKPGRS